MDGKLRSPSHGFGLSIPMDCSNSEPSSLGKCSGFSVPEEGGVGVSFQKALPSSGEPVRYSSLKEKGQAIRDGSISG